jgi:hypothetical protein
VPRRTYGMGGKGGGSCRTGELPVSIPLCFHSSVVIRYRRSTKRVRFADISHHVFLLVLAVSCPDPPRLCCSFQFSIDDSVMIQYHRSHPPILCRTAEPGRPRLRNGILAGCPLPRRASCYRYGILQVLPIPSWIEARTSQGVGTSLAQDARANV